MPTTEAVALRRLLGEYDLARAWSLDLVADLDGDQIAWRPDEHASGIGWHLGHQAAVNHVMVRNLLAAEASPDPRFDALFDSATPEPDRGDLPPLEAIVAYREAAAAFTHRVIERVADGGVGAPTQLARVGQGVLRAVIHHEYQHAAWIAEVRETLTERPAPMVRSSAVVPVDGYWMLDS